MANETTSSSGEAMPAPAPAPAALKIPWRDAAREIQAHLKIGRAIRNQRIRDQWELDQARTEKNEWMGRTTDLLNRIFTDPAVAEKCNEYVAPVLPEYAEFDLFADQFNAEMTQRLGRLQDVLKQLDTFPEAVPSETVVVEEAVDAPAVVVEAQAPAPAQKRVEEVSTPANEMSKQINISAVRSKPAEEHETHTVMLEESEMIAANPSSFPASGGTGDSPVSLTLGKFPSATPSNHGQVARATAVQSDTAVSGLLVIAGSDETTANAVHEFLRDLGFHMTVVDRRSGGSPSITEEAAMTHSASSVQARDASFAVMVAESKGAASADWLFDLGYCAGRLGAQRVCILHGGGEANPDRHGITHVPIDAGGGWQLHLARHLRRAGVPLDLNRLA